MRQAKQKAQQKKLLIMKFQHARTKEEKKELMQKYHEFCSKKD